MKPCKTARALQKTVFAAGLLYAAFCAVTCPTPEPPRSINIQGNVTFGGDVTFSSTFDYTDYKALKIHIYEEKSQRYLGSAPVKADNTWDLEVICEPYTRALFWVELLYKNNIPYYDSGHSYNLTDDMRCILDVTPHTEADSGVVIGAWIPLFSAADLARLGKDDRHPMNGNYILVTNIYIDSSWIPVDADRTGALFSGILNGKNNTIHIGALPGGTIPYTGVFARVSGGIIYDVTLNAAAGAVNLQTQNNQAAGLLAGCLEGFTVARNIEVTGTGGTLTVNREGQSECYAGGIAGIIRGHARIYNSNTNINIMLTASSPSLTAYCGGIAGIIDEEACIYQSSARGAVIVTNNGSGGAAAGGIAGGIYESASPSIAPPPHIKDSYSLARISASGDSAYAGGIAGYANVFAYIENCYSAGGASAVSLGGKSYAAGVLACPSGQSGGRLKNTIRGCAVFSQDISAGITAGKLSSVFLNRVTEAPCPDCSAPGASCFPANGGGTCACSTPNPSFTLEDNLAEQNARLTLNGTAVLENEPCNDGQVMPAISSSLVRGVWDFDTVWHWNDSVYPGLWQR